MRTSQEFWGQRITQNNTPRGLGEQRIAGNNTPRGLGGQRLTGNNTVLS